MLFRPESPRQASRHQLTTRSAPLSALSRSAAQQRLAADEALASLGTSQLKPDTLARPGGMRVVDLTERTRHQVRAMFAASDVDAVEQLRDAEGEACLAGELIDPDQSEGEPEKQAEESA